MNKHRRKIILIIISIVAIAAVAIAAAVARNESVVGGLSVHVSSSNPQKRDASDVKPLLSPSEIEQMLLDEYPGLTSSRVKDVDTRGMERFLRANPYIESAQVGISVGGRVIANTVTRRPIVRVYCNGYSFFVDRYGRCFQTRKNGNADVIVASGDFLGPLPNEPDSLDISAMQEDTLLWSHPLVNIWKLALFLDESADGYWRIFDQIFVESSGDLVLQPKFGNHDIVVGDTADLDEKFSRLKRFYAKGLPHAGYDSYSRVNIKYKEQIVCTKRKTPAKSR